MINKNIFINKNNNDSNKKYFTNKNRNVINKKSHINKKYNVTNKIIFTNKKEYAWNVIKNSIFIGMVSMLFYQSFVAFLCLQPLQIPMLRRQSEESERRKKRGLSIQFREVIMSVSANLQAGYSVENAFCESYQDVAMLFGTDSYMARELLLLRGKLKNNQTLELILQDLAQRTGVEEIWEFAEIFRIAKRSGGDLRGIIANTAKMIGDKIEVSKEIDTVMAEKVLEQRLMRYIPFVMIAYISMTSRGYFDSLYHNVFGVVVMTICLLLYGVASWMSDRILRIEV